MAVQWWRYRSRTSCAVRPIPADILYSEYSSAGRSFVVSSAKRCYLRSIKLLHNVIQSLVRRHALGGTYCPVGPEERRRGLAGGAVNGRASRLIAAERLRLVKSCGSGGASRGGGGRGGVTDAVSSGV